MMPPPAGTSDTSASEAPAAPPPLFPPPVSPPPVLPPAAAPLLPAGAGSAAKSEPFGLVLLVAVPQAARTAAAPRPPAPTRTQRRVVLVPACSCRQSTSAGLVCTSVMNRPPVPG